MSTKIKMFVSRLRFKTTKQDEWFYSGIISSFYSYFECEIKIVLLSEHLIVTI